MSDRTDLHIVLLLDNDNSKYKKGSSQKFFFIFLFISIVLSTHYFGANRFVDISGSGKTQSWPANRLYCVLPFSSAPSVNHNKHQDIVKSRTIWL